MKIGYACQTIGIPQTAFKSCTMKNATDENLMTVINQNLSSLDRIMDYNIANGIRLFRITSDLIPFGSSPANQLEWWKLFQPQLDSIGEKVRNHKIRISMHPGQYTVLNSPDETVVQRAIEDLEYHTRLLEAIDPSPENKIILHIGGAYGDKEKAMKRFVKNYKCLDVKIRKHLVIENDDRIYNIKEVMEISRNTDAPVVFDVLHHIINPDVEKKDIYDWIALSRETWSPEDGNQKIHYSQQNPLKKPGSHSDTIFLEEFDSFLNGLSDRKLDIMLEVKDKNLSAVKSLNLITDSPSILRLEQEWSHYKYLVLEKSHTDYNRIRQLLKDKESYPVLDFYALIDHALSMEATRGGAINAADHVWGYFKNCAEEKEKKRYLSLLNNFSPDSLTLKKFLWQMTKKYQEPYLMYSYYFIPVCKE